MKKIIYFDIDNTLINTRLLARLFNDEIARESQVPLEKIIEIQKEYASNLDSHTDFHPDDLIKFICKTINADFNDYKNIFDDKDIYQKVLFDETKQVLEELNKDNILGIYSEGFEDYQTKKLKLSGIIDYFDPDLMIIKRRKLEENSVSEIKNGSIVIDDNREVIETLKKCDNFETVWIKRKDDVAIEDVKTIENLMELKKFLN